MDGCSPRGRSATPWLSWPRTRPAGSRAPRCTSMVEPRRRFDAMHMGTGVGSRESEVGSRKPSEALHDSELSSDQLALETVQREIAACTLCVEAGFIPLSLPIFHGRVGQRLMIVG